MNAVTSFSFYFNNNPLFRSLEWDGFSLMTRVAEMYAVRETNDILAHCDTLNRVSEKRRQNTVIPMPILRKISAALTVILTSINNANYDIYSDEGNKMFEFISAVSDTIKTINDDGDLTAMFYQTIMRMKIWRRQWMSYFPKRRPTRGRPARRLRTASACENSEIK